MSHVCSCLELSIFRQPLGDTLQNSQFRKKLLLVFLVPDGSLDIIHPAFFQKAEYYGASEPPVRCGESHLSGLTKPPIDSYSA